MSDTIESRPCDLITTLSEIRLLVNQLLEWTDFEDLESISPSDILFIRSTVEEISEKLGRTAEWQQLTRLYPRNA